ncbi:MAG: FAD-dependent oxidoreductase [Gammaproteobacteria bacterium]|nr:MAG: FAD-dependent oxidoreductase [Gammaproteobacteria bacterium]
MGAESILPSHAPVVVIGGGVMGCSTLYHLAKFGVTDAILLERNQLTSGTTWHSAAQVRALRSTQNLTDLIRYSISLYSDLEQETGQATGWINKGSLSIACNPERLVHVKRQQSLANLFGVSASSISTSEALERWPLMNGDDVLGAVWSPDDGRVSPSDLCAALVRGAKSRGARIFEDIAVTGIVTESGKIRAVETPRGTIRCDAIALCTGLWSRKAAAMAGVDVPVWPCEHFYLLTKPVDGIRGNLPTLSDHDSQLYIRDDSGGLLVGCFEPMGKPIDPDVLGEDFAFGLLDEDWEHFEPMLENALHRLPVLESAEIRMLLNGPESFTPDGSFLLGESAETRGLFLGCGMNSVGVATGGGAGMALARNIVDGHLPFDMFEADPKRYPGCWNNIRHLSARVPEVLGKHYEITFPGRQMTTARDLVKLPLHDQWLEQRAHFGQFYGYERPLYFDKTREPVLTFDKPDWFEQVGEEVRRAHEAAALFDQSSFGKIRVSGSDAETYLDRICANNMARPAGCAIYTSMLNQRGGIESDLTALRLSEDSYRLYVGTSAIKRDLAWLECHLLPHERVRFENESEDYAVIGLMGPQASAIVERVGASELNELSYFRHGETEIAGLPVRAVRLSYVGEAGWEITCRAADAVAVYRALAQQGARPAGLLAQTSMRIEKRFLAYGHELDTDINPLQVGLGFAVAWESDFIGRDALLAFKEKKSTKQVVTILFRKDSAVPLGNEPVLIDDRIVGKTTSAAFGYRVGKPVALAFVDNAVAIKGADVSIDIAGRQWRGSISTRAAFDPDAKLMRP